MQVAALLIASLLLPILARAEEGRGEGGARATVKAEVHVKASTTPSANSGRGASTTPKTIKDRISEKKDEVKSKIEEKRGEVQDKIKARVDEFTKKVIERYEAALDRLVNLAARIDSRIAKFEAEGTNQAKAKELMVTAKAKIEIAKTSIANIKAGIYATSTASTTSVTASSTATTTPSLKPGFDRLRLVMQKAKTDLKAAHAALVEVVKNIKPGRNKTATTTPTGSGSSTTTPNTSTSTATTTP
jgi:hypothetical protein